MPTIRVTIQNGKATVETEGYVGDSCFEATRDLKEALGEVVEEERTAEAFESGHQFQTADY